MALLHTLPVIARADVGIVRLAADGGRVEEDFRAHQRHAARAFREPLIPADADTDAGISGVPDLEAGIARIEVVLLVVAWAVRDMAFPINTEIAAVGIDDGDAVEARAAGALEEADRQHHLQLGSDLLEVLDGRIFCHRGGQLGVVGVRFLAEVGRLEQLLDQDDLGALGCRLAHQPLGVGDVRGGIPGAGHLGRGDGNDTGHEAPLGSFAGRSGGPFRVPWLNIDQGGMFDLYPINIGIRRCFGRFGEINAIFIELNPYATQRLRVRQSTMGRGIGGLASVAWRSLHGDYASGAGLFGSAAGRYRPR